MRAVFADTAYFLALLNPRDALHPAAVEWSRSLDQPVVTTLWVVQELADGMSTPPARTGFVRLFKAIEADEQTAIVSFETTLWRRGLELYTQRPDKAWSLTDCLSFIVMTDQGLTEALTSDHHFEQAGFRALPRVS